MLQISISKKAVLKFNLAKNLPDIAADATQVRQVVMNLVINASEAIGEKSGVISISTGAMDCDRSYLQENYLNEDLSEGLYSYVEVADTGCGMDKDTLSKIFDPFFTTKEVGRGTGQGLAISHTVIVEKHSGSINFETKTGKGTTFIIQLPIQNEEE